MSRPPLDHTEVSSVNVVNIYGSKPVEEGEEFGVDVALN